MTNKQSNHAHHSVLVVEGNKPVQNILNLWLHDVEKDIEVDSVATAEEARERLRHQSGKQYDLVIADEYLPGLDTGLDLYRHCLNYYPEVPFAVTSENELAADEDLPPILNPAMPTFGHQLIGTLLEEKSLRQQLDQIKLGAVALALTGAFLIAWGSIGTSAKAILQSPPFTDRFIIVPGEAADPFYYDEVKTTPFDSASVFTPELKFRMAQILATADEIVAMTK